MVVGLTMAQFSFMQLGLKCTTDNKILGVHNPVMGRGGGGSISYDKTTTFSADPICRLPFNSGFIQIDF